MRDNYILTAESVTEGHPDKLCDAIADSVLDACLKHDPAARVACEVMATAGKIIVAGEITAAELPDIPAIVCQTVRETGYGSDYEVEVITHDQSGDIAGAVAQETQMGAGDQGIVYGFACSETAELLPLPVVLAHRLTLLLTNARKTGTIQGLGPDGKAQVSVEYQNGKPCRIATVVVSCQHDADKDMDELRREITRHVIVPALRELYPDHKTEVFINPSGRFVLGGFEADTGLTGRKLMADTYGGLAPPWRRGAVREGRQQGGPQRGLHGPVHRQEHRGRWAGGTLHRQPRLRHRQGRAGGGGHRRPPDREVPGGCAGAGRPGCIQPDPLRDDLRPGAGPAHLRAVLQLWPLYSPGRPLGADGPGRRIGGRCGR